MLTITKAVIDAISTHAMQELPYEACGYLAGNDNTVSCHYELTNLDKAADHFSMDPKEQFAAIKDIRQQNMQLLAVYHSHPETPARPSEEDIRLAYDPEISYLIISLATSECSIKSFKIRQGEVFNEKIKELPWR